MAPSTPPLSSSGSCASASSSSSSPSSNTINHQQQSCASTHCPTKQFIFHAIDPCAQEVKRKKDREFMASQMFHGLIFRPSKYMGMLKIKSSTTNGSSNNLNTALERQSHETRAVETCANNYDLNCGVRSESSFACNMLYNLQCGIDNGCCNSRLSCLNSSPYQIPHACASLPILSPLNTTRTPSRSIHHQATKKPHSIEKTYHMKSILTQTSKSTPCLALSMHHNPLPTEASSNTLSVTRKIRTSISISELLN